MEDRELTDEEKENKFTLTGHIVVSSLCKSAVERIEELEKENAELKGIKDIATLIRANNNTVITLMQLNNMLVSKNQQLNKAKELLTKWIELFKPKGGNILPTPIQIETEQFIIGEERL